MVSGNNRGFISFGLMFLIFLLILMAYHLIGNKYFVTTVNKILSKEYEEDKRSFEKSEKLRTTNFSSQGLRMNYPGETVTASGEYRYGKYTVAVSLTFPLDGGSVNGSFSGSGCSGSIIGNYAGGSGGAISGKASGTCLLVLPASGTFTGTVNQSRKTVTTSGTGKVANFSGGGSMTLSYK